MRASLLRVIALLVPALLPGAISAALADQPAGISTQDGRIVETARAGLETQGFVNIENAQASADTLTAVECAVADRTSLAGPKGNAIDNLVVAAGQTLSLTADGPHIVLQSTHFSIDAGGAVPCSLIFRNAGEISVYLYPIPAAK